MSDTPDPAAAAAKVVAVTDTAVPREDLERALADEFRARYNSCADGLDIEECLNGADVVFTNFAPLGRDLLSLASPGAAVDRRIRPRRIRPQEGLRRW